ncbi:MAG TPA: hypothetical protein VFF53_13615 [Geobacteraceae bacterium]|nr:hypothetical protein [Geobacteraceae bacterium]
MNNLLKHIALSVSVLSVTVSLTACGGGSSSTPTTVPNSATVFYAHSLVFRNTTTGLLSAGYNAFGQLGTGNLANRSTPGAVRDGLLFSGQAAGGNHSVAFFNNSTVRSWGYNGFGQLGNDSTTYSSVPVKTVNIRGVKAVAAGMQHSLALRNDDTVWAWGDNSYGQIGVEKCLDSGKTIAYCKIPVMVGEGIVPFNNISSIAAGYNHSLVRANGKVWAWGSNSSGQLGLDRNQTGASAPHKVDGLPDGIIAIAAGGAFSYAVSADGKVWAWGNNDNGQLGNETPTDRLENKALEDSFTPVLVLTESGLPLDGVVQVSAGKQHGLARRSNGTVWAWGYNIFGQLGNNDKKTDNKPPDDKHYAVQVVADATGTPFTGATDIRAFGSSSMARNGSGWFAWGDNAYGQLGTGSTGTLLLPVKSGF